MSSKERINILDQKIDLLGKSVTMDLEKLYKILKELSKMIDLQYLELAVILELMSKKGVISEEEFKNQLDETSARIMETAKAEMAKMQSQSAPAMKEERKEDENTEGTGDTKSESPILTV